MIYVTVGSAEKGAEFDRLIKKIDEIAKNIDEEIMIQLGSSQYIPKYAKYFDYCSYEESLSFFKKAELVIGHCGSGTVLNAISFNKPLIAIPRMLIYNELDSDDHQLELARELEKINSKIKVVYDVDDLEGIISEMLKKSSQSVTEYRASSNKICLIQTIKSFVKSELLQN